MLSFAGLVSNAIVAEARELARIITGGLDCPREGAPSRRNAALDAVLSEVGASGLKYMPFLAALEEHAIRDALERAGSIKRAAEWLGMKRSTLISKTAKLGIGPIAGHVAEGP